MPSHQKPHAIPQLPEPIPIDQYRTGVERLAQQEGVQLPDFGISPIEPSQPRQGRADELAGEVLEKAGIAIDRMNGGIDTAVGRAGQRLGISSDTIPKMDRRRFMIGAGTAAAAALLGIRATRPDRQTGPLPEAPAPDTAETSVLEPRIALRPRPEQFGDADISEADQTTAEHLRRLAPVFTIAHTVKSGETATELARRYYLPSDSFPAEETFAQGLAAIAAANGLGEDMQLAEGKELYIPVSEPVVVATEGKSLEDIAEEWGFGLDALTTVNSDVPEEVEGHVYLPMQQMPTLADDEQLYLVKPATDGHLMTYYSIAQELGTGLSTLIGRNKPVPTHLEHGHILVASHPEEPGDTTTTSTVATTTTTTTPEPGGPSNPGDEDGVTPEDLIAERTWSGEIVRTIENDELEQNITIERLEEVVATRERFLAWLDTIDRDTFVTVFEKANTLHPEGIIESPDFFIIHHTAQGVEPGITGMERLTGSMVGGGLSVQWAISHEESGGGSKTYQLVSDPKLACNHAYGVNDRATGVELITDDTRAQGSVTTEQLEQAIYLAYYVVVHQYGKHLSDGRDIGFVRGHREVNDMLDVGSEGKPDFFEPVMDVFRSKLQAFAEDMVA